MVKNVLKLLVTVAIFVGLFFEFGAAPVSVDPAALRGGEAFMEPDPEQRGEFVPLAREAVCQRAASQKPVFVRDLEGLPHRIKALRHCVDDDFAVAMVTSDGDMKPLEEIKGDRAWVVGKGFQLVEIDFADLWREITSVNPVTFAAWFLFATLIKLVGILANIYRWKVLLDAQGVRLSFRWLNRSYWVGRYWGIVTPSTMGLDGWRLYDTIRTTRQAIPCTTALAVERLIGLVSLLGAILLIAPFADIGNADFRTLFKALVVPLFVAVAVALLFVMQPGWFSPLVRAIPNDRVRKFVREAITSATAYSQARGALLIALGCAIFGQFTTMFMYVGNAYALGIEGVEVTQILAATAVMTFGTFIFPSASGEGVREVAFVALLGGHTTAAKAFLIGHLGFWIEKLPLSLPGGLLMFSEPEAYQRVTKDDLDRLKAEVAAEGTPANEA